MKVVAATLSGQCMAWCLVDPVTSGRAKFFGQAKPSFGMSACLQIAITFMIDDSLLLDRSVSLTDQFLNATLAAPSFPSLLFYRTPRLRRG